MPVIWRLKRFGTWELRSTAYAGASMISAPQLRSIPYYYLQYRLTVGIEWYP